jgi:ureidoacrylate peracid hydrolase
MGVESTVRAAYDLDYNVVLLSDCCGAYSEEAHNYPIQKIFPRMGRVMTSVESLEFLQ